MTATEPMYLGPAPIVDAGPDPGEQVARAISNLLSPPALAVPVMLLAAAKAGDPAAWRHVALYACIAVLPPLSDLIWRRRTGHIDDIHLPDRRDRRRAFVGGILCSSLALSVLVALGAAPLVVAMATATLVQAVVLFLITLRWQVSVHSASAASLVTLALILLGREAALVVPVLPLVAWSRLRLARHTPAQVLVGAAVGASAALLVLLVR